MRKKIISVILIILFCFVITACNSKSKEIGVYNPYSSTLAEERIRKQDILIEILECFDERNSERLKSLFSIETQVKDGFSDSIEKAFSMYEGISLSYKGFFDNGIVYSHRSDGRYTKKCVGADMEGILTTSGNTYIISFEEYVIYDENSKMIGVSRIILRDKDYALLCAIG